MNWIYASSNERPKQKEEVLCDLGEAFYFVVLIYDNGYFYDTGNGDCFYLEINVKRWCHIGKHYDEQF